MTQTVNDEWNDFAKAVLSPQVTGIQRSDMKFTFFAGASAVLHALQRVLDPEVEPTADDRRIVDSIYHELITFYARRSQGQE